MKELTKFEQAFSLNVNEKTEKKEGLTYLSWAWAWAEFKKVYPDATYQVRQFEGKPFFADEALGYMVFTSVTAEGTTHEMWLPVMNGANKAMKAQSYSYTTKFGEKTVEAASMFDINKTLMRCFTKNLAMFGLGLYIYAGEDLPEVSEEARSEAFEAFKKQVDAINSKDELRVFFLANKGKGEEFDAYVIARAETLPDLS